MPVITRRFAERCSDLLHMELSLGAYSVKGKKKVVLDLGGLKMPFQIEVKCWFANSGQSAGDAGLLLQGPGNLGVALLRNDGDYLLQLFDLSKLGGNLVKWWRKAGNGVVDSPVFLDLTKDAAQGTYRLVKGEWLPE